MLKFENSLNALKAQNRLRSLNLPCGIDLTSNDYLGMAQHPVLKKAAITALENGLDIGAAGSRLLRGQTQAHLDLEDFAANYFKAQASLYFSSGFQANYALLTSLPQRGDIVLYDALVHASMRDGLSASKAKSFKFPHNDLNALEGLLKRYHDKADTLWVAIESVYSMDGDCAQLSEIYVLAERYNAFMIIDEAHASGIYGWRGRGLVFEIIEQYGYERIVTLHTCGKAIGVAGGLVCASREVVDFLINTARPFIYSTAPMPLQALLVQKSLEILDTQDGEGRRQKLSVLCERAQSLFGGAGTQIVPVVLGEDETAVRVAGALQAKGYDIRAIRPPTVPQGSARLRLSLSSELDESVLQTVANDLKSFL